MRPGGSRTGSQDRIFEAIYRLSQTDQVLYRHAERDGLKDQKRASCAVLGGHLVIDGTTLDDEVFRTGALPPELGAQATQAAQGC